MVEAMTERTLIEKVANFYDDTAAALSAKDRRIAELEAIATETVRVITNIELHGTGWEISGPAPGLFQALMRIRDAARGALTARRGDE